MREITLWEFGPALRSHPEFDAMLASIETAMAGNSRLQERFVELIADLQREPG